MAAPRIGAISAMRSSPSSSIGDTPQLRISGDYDTTADIGVLAAGIEAGLADVVAAAHD